MQIIPPVFERELRVSARRRGTFWMRVAVAGTAALVGSWLLVTMQMTYVRQPSDVSQSVFATVSGLAALYCFLAGLLLTSDCISSEKREGTLGLLFLTDLKGYSVVFGKMLATSLSAFYSLTAIFPVLAIPLLLGGIPPEVFWKMTGFLVNVMFLSLSTGMLMSVLGRAEMRTVGWTMLVLMFFLGGIPLLGIVGADLWHRLQTDDPVRDIFSQPPPQWTLWFCPAFGFIQLMNEMFSGGAGRGFWSSMIAIHACGWSFLGLASARVPFCWQDRATSIGQMEWRKRMIRWSHGSPEFRARFRRALLDVNAFFWLAARNRLKPWAVWMVLAATGLFWFWGFLKWPSDFNDEWVIVLIGLWLSTVLKLWIASESCQRMAEDHQTGALELLLSTPLSVPNLLRGQWLALRRQFLWPAVVVLGYFLLAGTRLANQSADRWLTWLAVAGAIVLVADLITLPWVGMWLGLLKRNASKAFASTTARILLLPWIVFGAFSAVMGVLAHRLPRLNWSERSHLFAWVLLCVAWNCGFLYLARRNLLMRFRSVVAERTAIPPGSKWWPFWRRTKASPATAR